MGHDHDDLPVVAKPCQLSPDRRNLGEVRQTTKSTGAGDQVGLDGPPSHLRNEAEGQGDAGAPDPFDVVVVGPLPAPLNRPASLAFVPGAGLFIADESESVILLAGF